MELTTDSLEYIIYVAKEYCYPNKKQLKDCDEIEDAESAAVSIAIPKFQCRYPFIMEEFKEAYDKYLSNDEIQKTLTIYKLNADKFWLLFLFIADFTNSCFKSHWKSEKYTIREVANRMAQLINKEGVNDYSLTLSCEEDTISSKNPLLIALFGHFCTTLNDNNDYALDIASIKSLKVTESTVKTKKIKFFVELFRHFLYNHVEVRQPSKMSFIGKFLYLAKIEEEECYYNGYSPTLLTPKNKFLVKRYGTIAMNGKEFIKEPVDVGKDIADTIKNCTDYAPTGVSTYFCAPF